MTGRWRDRQALPGAAALVLAALALWPGIVPAPAYPFGQVADSESARADRAAVLAQVEALQAQATAARSQGDSQGAARALSAAGALLVQWRGRTPFDPDVLKFLGIQAYWLGQLSKDRNDLDDATRHWSSYLELSGHLSRLQPRNVEWWIERSYGLNNLGSLAVARADWTRAAHAFTGSIALKRRALGARPDDAALVAELADSLSWLGTAREALGQFDAAHGLYDEELALLARLRAQAPDQPEWMQREARALWRRANLLVARGRDGAALTGLRQAARAYAVVTAAHPDNRTWQVEQASVALRIEEILGRDARALESGGGAAATARLGAIHARMSRLQQLDPGKRTWAQIEANARIYLSAALLREGRADEARRHALAAASRLDVLGTSAGDNAELRMATARAQLRLAEIDGALGEPARARQACGQARTLMVALGANALDHRVLDPWVRVNLCLGEARAARAAAGRLHAIGYRDGAFQRLLTSH